jgi:hypothetical protein
LDIDNELVAKWNCYKQNLIGAGIRLQEWPDTLIWTGGDKIEKISIKNVYRAIAEVV